MSERGDSLFTAEAAEAAAEFYDGLREFVVSRARLLPCNARPY